LGKQSFLFNPNRGNWGEIYLFSHNSCLLRINDDLQTIDSIANSDLTNQSAFIDIDNDNQEECIIFKDNQIEIYRKNFQYKTTIALPGLRARKIYLSMKENENGTRYLSVQNDNYQFFIEYKQNIYYWTGYFWYFLLALLILVALVFMVNLYQHQLKRQRRRQQEFFQLKFDLLKSSLDPHFLFNALNSISFSINKDDRKTAYSNLGIFSKFMRESLSSVESFEHDFGEEVNYIKNYLMLEKFRFKELFDYTIIISPEVKMTTKVPRLSLFCFIENALKKGVLSKKGGGFIELAADISSDQKALVVKVSDNGIYRDLTNDANCSQNFKVVLRLFELLNQENRNHIEVTMKPNMSDNKPQGCCIGLLIPFEYNFTINQ
jgi:sensor histidine kinase YesM